MDSLTHIILGATVGQVMLGRHMGAGKAMLLGALACTIPDADVIPLAFTDMVTSLNYHRSFSHSFVFCVGMPALLSSGIRQFFSRQLSFWRWYWFWFFGFLAHILIDACTTWGTQLFWPLPYRVSLNSIFIIDPLYTLLLFIPLIVAWRTSLTKHHAASRRAASFASIGLILSSSYLLLGVGIKTYIHHQVDMALIAQGLKVTRYMTRPTPFNTLLWAITAETDQGYISGYRSLFDHGPIVFSPPEPKNHARLTPYKNNHKLTTLLAITDGYYRVEKTATSFAIYDLRFGQFGSWGDQPGTHVFVYLFNPDKATFIQAKRRIKNPQKLLGSLWQRVWGISS